MVRVSTDAVLTRAIDVDGAEFGEFRTRVKRVTARRVNS
jgi:hypothetical protein